MEQDERKKDPSTAAAVGGNNSGGKDNGIGNSYDGDALSNDHMAAMAGWKARKEQLHLQQKSVDSANNEAEKVNLVALSKKKNKDSYND